MCVHFVLAMSQAKPLNIPACCHKIRDSIHSLSVCLPNFLSCHYVQAVQHLAAHVYPGAPYVL